MTLRAEMVRLRRGFQELNPARRPESRPLRAAAGPLPDAGQVLNCLQRGAHRIALEIYRGAVLPRSEAPGIGGTADQGLRAHARSAADRGSAESLLKYAELPEARDDVGVRIAALKLLPPRSPKRTAVVADLERLDGNWASDPTPAKAAAAGSRRRDRGGVGRLQPDCNLSSLRWVQRGGRRRPCPRTCTAKELAMTVYASPAPGSKVTFKSRYDNWIGGEWVAPVKGQYFENISR